MSDTSQGPGWWRASDDKWYPPESAARPPPPDPTPPARNDVSPGPGYWRATDGNWYPPQSPPAVMAKKKIYQRVWFWLLIVVALGIGGCVSLVATAGVAVNNAAHANHTVVYSVTGSGTANDITYDTLQQGSGQNGEAQVTDVNLPWTKTITASGLFTVFSVNATVGQDGGSLTCTITEDGKQIATNTASGAFASADCTSGGQ